MTLYRTNIPETTESPVQSFLRGLEVVMRSILRASDAGHHADVEGMLDILHQQVGALTPWANARICTNCWHVIPTLAVAHTGRNHRGICAICLERQHDAGAPNYIPSEN
jgi:hypothetical protein